MTSIETERLVLRRHERGDLDACAQMWADPIVTRHIGGKIFSRYETWRKMMVYAGLWTLLGYGYWAVEERSTGRFIGELGFADFKREMEPPLDGVPELGWALVSSAHGKGYATEAVRAAVAWGDANLESRRTVCMIDPDNLPSVRVAQKCGYREYLRIDYGGGPTVLFERITA
ncbi:MAG TPA: GNAT family N-acetyltransferase [Candidatus Eremiobacteraceae bacterium]